MDENALNSLLTANPEETPVYSVEPAVLLETCAFLKNDLKFRFDYLMCLSGVDYKEYIEVVYHIYSMEHKRRAALKVRFARENPEVDSVASVWKSADWHEREAFDLLGIKFNNHPDLRRILLPEDWTDGYPLRKDYEHKPDQYD